MQVFDASAIISGWDAYQEPQFPSLWRWLGREVAAGSLTISEVAFDEVKKKQPDCAKWLQGCNVTITPITSAVTAEAMRIKDLLGIRGEAYGRGVGENDLLIVASAKQQNATLITNENRQPQLPVSRHNYKIPAVGGLQSVKVQCLSFVEMIKASGQVF